MTDKVQKIREEVERLQNELIQEKKNGFGSDTDDACILELQNILTYIDSLQGNPCDGCTNRKGCITCENGELRETVQEEPVSEELEEEIDVYLATKKWREINETFSADRLISFARHFAKWQEKQDQSTIELAEDHAMLAGMEKMKEEMMAKAVDGEVGYWNQRGLSVNMDLPRTLEEDDKVKLIIIKEG